MFKIHVSSIELFASYSSNLFILCDVEKKLFKDVLCLKFMYLVLNYLPLIRQIYLYYVMLKKNTSIT